MPPKKKTEYKPCKEPRERIGKTLKDGKTKACAIPCEKLKYPEKSVRPECKNKKIEKSNDKEKKVLQLIRKIKDLELKKEFNNRKFISKKPSLRTSTNLRMTIKDPELEKKINNEIKEVEKELYKIPNVKEIIRTLEKREYTRARQVEMNKYNDPFRIIY